MLCLNKGNIVLSSGSRTESSSTSSDLASLVLDTGTASAVINLNDDKFGIPVLIHQRKQIRVY